jgi:hypothetical protein
MTQPTGGDSWLIYCLHSCLSPISGLVSPAAAIYHPRSVLCGPMCCRSYHKCQHGLTCKAQRCRSRCQAGHLAPLDPAKRALAGHPRRVPAGLETRNTHHSQCSIHRWELTAYLLSCVEYLSHDLRIGICGRLRLGGLCSSKHVPPFALYSPHVFAEEAPGRTITLIQVI